MTLAAFKNPKIFLFSSPIFALGIAVVFWQSMRITRFNNYLIKMELDIRADLQSIPPDEKEKEVNNRLREIKLKMPYSRGRSSIMIALTFIVGIVTVEVKGQLERIQGKQDYYSVVKMRTNEHLLHDIDNKNLVLITATERFVFFYLNSANSNGNIFIVPNASIASIELVPTSYPATNKNTKSLPKKTTQQIRE